MLKIAHISDIHIRNLKFHDEYRAVFQNLYDDLRENVKPDLIVNTGDTAHTKTQISPEFVQLTSELLLNLSKIAPQDIILGNHDLNLMNPDRQDAITPIVQSIGRHPGMYPIRLHKKSGPVIVSAGTDGKKLANLWIYSLADQENYPTYELITSEKWSKTKPPKIGLFHGSVANCVTDSDWVMTSAEVDLSLFAGLDFVLMGDIHKKQQFGSRIRYAGSLIQQNFGEDPDKGYLVWTINGKDDFDVEFRPLRGSRGFYTVRLNEDGSIPEMMIPSGSRVRIISQRNLNLVEQKNVERDVRNLFKPKDIVSITSPETTHSRKEKIATGTEIENIRSLDVQEKLLRDFFKGSKLSESVLEKITEINKKFQLEIESGEEVVRNVFWRVNKLGWNNMFNYGEGNFIDFSKIHGFTGIFAPNTAGKSSIFEIFMEGLFDKVTKDVSKNIELINDNKETAKIIVDLSVGNQNYVVERTIEKIKYGQRKAETKEWGKMSLDFFLDDGTEKLSLNGTLRPETERAIRKRIGNFDDFVLSTISAQEPISGIPGGANLIQCKETDRKKILCKFLDLDIFDQKCNLAKIESKKFVDRLEQLHGTEIEEKLTELKEKKQKQERDISSSEELLNELEKQISQFDAELVTITSSLKEIGNHRARSKIISDLENYRSLLTKEKNVLEKNERDVETQTKTVAALNEQISSSSSRALADVESEFTSLVKEVGKLETRIERQNAKALDKKKKLKLLDEVPCGVQYPQCKFLVDAFESKQTVDDDLVEIENLRKQLVDLKLQVSAKQIEKEIAARAGQLQTELRVATANLNLYKRNVELATLNIQKNEQKVQELTQELHAIDSVDDLIKHNDEVKRMISVVETSKQKTKDLVGALKTEINKKHRELGALSVALERYEKDLNEIEDLKTVCIAYENYIEAMGKYGIAYRILTEKLPVINDEINKILSNVVNFSVFLEHDPQEQTIRLYLQYGDYRSRNLGLASGAEKFLSSLAIRAALLNVSSLPKTNMFIVDEGFGKLDTTHLESIQKMFDYLRTVFEHVIVISHVDVLKDMVDNMIEITTDSEGYAHVEVV